MWENQDSTEERKSSFVGKVPKLRPLRDGPMSHIDVCCPKTISCKLESSFRPSKRESLSTCLFQTPSTNFRLTLIVSFQMFWSCLLSVVISLSILVLFNILSHTLVHSLQFSISLIIVSCISCRLPSLPNCLNNWCVVSLTRSFCFLVCFIRQCLICFAGYYCKTYI